MKMSCQFYNIKPLKCLISIKNLILLLIISLLSKFLQSVFPNKRIQIIEAFCFCQYISIHRIYFVHKGLSLSDKACTMEKEMKSFQCQFHN